NRPKGPRNMAEDTLKLTLQERRDLREAVKHDLGTPQNAINALAEVRHRDLGVAATTTTVGTELRRILRSNDVNDQNGVVSLQWQEDLVKVVPSAAPVFARARARSLPQNAAKAIAAEWSPDVPGGLIDDVVALHTSHEIQE